MMVLRMAAKLLGYKFEGGVRVNSRTHGHEEHLGVSDRGPCDDLLRDSKSLSRTDT